MTPDDRPESSPKRRGSPRGGLARVSLADADGFGSSGGERRVGDDSGAVVHAPPPGKAVMGLWRPSRVLRCTRTAVMVAAVAVSSCGGSSAGEARVLSETEYLAVVKRNCAAARQIAERALRTSAAPAGYLRRATEAAESIQREFAKVRPPTRFAAAHRESLRLGDKQLALIRTVLARLHGGALPYRHCDRSPRSGVAHRVGRRCVAFQRPPTGIADPVEVRRDQYGG